MSYLLMLPVCISFVEILIKGQNHKELALKKRPNAVGLIQTNGVFRQKTWGDCLSDG